jgi:hypothetical protein
MCADFSASNEGPFRLTMQAISPAHLAAMEERRDRGWQPVALQQTQQRGLKGHDDQGGDRHGGHEPEGGGNAFRRPSVCELPKPVDEPASPSHVQEPEQPEVQGAEAQDRQQAHDQETFGEAGECALDRSEQCRKHGCLGHPFP